MINIPENDLQHNVAWTILPALLIPETGCALHTIAAAGGVKVLANVEMCPGGGLDLDARRMAVEAHDICQVCVHADVCEPDGDLPLAIDFHAPTLLWAVENAEQIALWWERGTDRHAEVVAWTVKTAHEGSRFQVVVNATPEHAGAWLTFIERWQREGAEVRVFGPEALQ